MNKSDAKKNDEYCKKYPRNNFPASGARVGNKIIQVALKNINNQDKKKRGENWQNIAVLECTRSSVCLHHAINFPFPLNK